MNCFYSQEPAMTPFYQLTATRLRGQPLS
ncbi:glutathione peroxidase, partial [Klebsiella pneumoniae]